MTELHPEGAAPAKRDAPALVYSGEIHYFRIPPRLWPVHLERARQAHLNTVSSYIPWRWHELEEGRWDFDGSTHPRRDLLGFIELVQQHGLCLWARVGPVCNGEMVAEGLPDFLSARYPEALLQLAGGQAIHHTGVPSYLHPLFLDKVARWYAQLLPLLRPHQHREGGCITMVQLCNEIAMVNWVGQQADASPHVTARYQAFLADRYGDIAALNQAHGSSHAAFEAVPQPPVDFDGCLPATLDRALFFRDYLAQYFAALHQMAQEHGLRGPFSANIPHFYDYDVRGRGLYAPLTTSLFRDFGARVPGLVFGGAYQPRRVDWDNFHDIFITSAMVRMIADPDAPTICAELQSGILSDRPRLYPSDVELNILSSLASGLDGLNAYMFSGGTNPDGLGQFGTHHGWQAPVAQDGALAAHFAPLARHGAWLERLGSLLAATRPAATVQLGFYAPYWMTEFMRGPAATTLERRRTAGFFDGMARLLCLLGYPFYCVDLQRQALDPTLPLYLFTTEVMDPLAQQRVVDYVAAGGRLFLGPGLPSADLGGEPCRILAERLGLARVAPRRGLRLHYDADQYFAADTATVLVRQAGDEPYLWDERGQPVAMLSSHGAGQVVFCGFPLSDRFACQVSLFQQMARALGVQQPVTCSDPDLVARIRQGEQGSFVFLINYHENPVAADVTVHGAAPLTRPVTVPPRSGRVLLFRPGQDAAKDQLLDCELVEHPILPQITIKGV